MRDALTDKQDKLEALKVADLIYTKLKKEEKEVSEWAETILKLEDEIEQKEMQIKQKDAQIEQKDAEIEQKDARIAELMARLEAVES